MRFKYVAIMVVVASFGTALANETKPDLAIDEEDARFPTTSLREANAMYRRAISYEKGSNGMPPDREQMLKWLKLASSRGSGIASYKLHNHYAMEPTGYAEANEYWNLARQQGYCGEPVIGNIRGPKPEYVVLPCGAR